jgi:hypothetical protein
MRNLRSSATRVGSILVAGLLAIAALRGRKVEGEPKPPAAVPEKATSAGLTAQDAVGLLYEWKKGGLEWE